MTQTRGSTRRRELLLVVCMQCVLSLLAASLAAAEPRFVAAVGDGVRDQYIVVLEEGIAPRGAELVTGAGPSVGELAANLAEIHGGRVKAVLEHALQGFVVSLPEAAARRLALDPRVRWVEQDRVVPASAQPCPTETQQMTNYPMSPQVLSWPTAESNWGLDRIDQRTVQPNWQYAFSSTGLGVHVYVLDTGIRDDHEQFRSSQGFGPYRIGNGRNFASNEARDSNGNCVPVDYGYLNPADTFDLDGHGTHVAAIAGGRWYGVAKEVTLHPVRIANACGYTSVSVVAAGVDWIYANAVKPAVVNFSFNLDDPSPQGCLGTLGTAFRNLIAQRGILVVNSAGNHNTDASNFVPTCLPEVLVVGATSRADTRWGPPSAPWSYCLQDCGSDWGAGVDLFAPGESIDSAGIASQSGVCERTGTSMAAPHATGVAALYLQRHPNATPAQVHAAIVNGATVGALTGDLGAGSPNRLLYSLIDLP